MRRAARSGAGDRVVDHGSLSAGFRRAHEGARRQMVRHGEQRRRGTRSRDGRRRRHRRAFDAKKAESQQVGLFALLPAVVDAVRVPVIATGGIGDARGIAAALLLGASAAQIGTGFLRCPEARLAPAWADAIGRTLPEQTVVTRAFSGRPGRSIANEYARAATSPEAPAPAPYPVQRGLTAAMRVAAGKAGDIDKMQAWAGQAAAFAQAKPAGDIVRELWDGARALL